MWDLCGRTRRGGNSVWGARKRVRGSAPNHSWSVMNRRLGLMWASEGNMHKHWNATFWCLMMASTRLSAPFLLSVNRSPIISVRNRLRVTILRLTSLCCRSSIQLFSPSLLPPSSHIIMSWSTQPMMRHACYQAAATTCNESHLYQTCDS